MLAAVTKIESDVHRDTLKRLLRKSDVNIAGKVCNVMLDHVIHHNDVGLYRTLRRL